MIFCDNFLGLDSGWWQTIFAGGAFILSGIALFKTGKIKELGDIIKSLKKQADASAKTVDLMEKDLKLKFDQLDLHKAGIRAARVPRFVLEHEGYTQNFFTVNFKNTGEPAVRLELGNINKPGDLWSVPPNPIKQRIERGETFGIHVNIQPPKTDDLRIDLVFYNDNGDHFQQNISLKSNGKVQISDPFEI